MREEIHFDLLGQRKLIFDDDGVAHFTDEIYFVVPIALPVAALGVSYSVVSNRLLRYDAIRSIGVVRKKQWWALTMGLLFCPLWLFCMGGSLTNNPPVWGMVAVSAVFLLLSGVFPLWLFWRGRPFLCVATDKEAICVPMDRKVSKLRRAFAILKERVASPSVRWEIDSI